MQERAVGRRREDAAVVRIAGDDELIDLWLVLRKGWRWVLAGLLVGTLAGAAYLTLVAPTYESRSSIYVGKVGDLGLENPDLLAAQLVERYGRQPNGAPYLKEVTQPARQSTVLRLVAVAHSPEDARDFLRRIVSGIMQRHQELYRAGVQSIEQRAANIEEKIAALRAQTAEFGEIIASLKNSRPDQASLAAIERARLYPMLNQLERDRITLQQQLTRPYSRPSEIIAQPGLPTDPASLPRAVVIVVGIALGLAIGLFAALLREVFATLAARRNLN